ncbi:hypothetical protein MCOR31_001456 [Pyricularia oryzae]|nr:hypothetical protein MCOR31_001456 [Pyricularia oryzae]KAI6484262.1 hypothetical protein MCOR11_010192 [Pyricularia oryzae]
MASPGAGIAHTGSKYRDPPRNSDVQVAIFCALAVEADAIVALLDHCWDVNDYRITEDPMSYTIGLMGERLVVVVHIPGPGKIEAASAATHCRRSFPSIVLAIVSGVCGGVPCAAGREIILGDVLISEKVVQHDFGSRTSKNFVRKESLGRVDTATGSLLAKLKTQRAGEGFRRKVDAIIRKESLAIPYPGVQHDVLFEASYEHGDNKNLTCNERGCNGPLVRRKRLQHGSVEFLIHIGTIASGDTVLRSGKHRDDMAEKDGIIGFEMEGAGIWSEFRSVVIIKGVSDYADSHKTKTWQQYAASRSAAATKVFLHFYPNLTASLEPRLPLMPSAVSTPQPVSQHNSGSAKVATTPGAGNILELDERIIIAFGAGITGMNFLVAVSLSVKSKKSRKGDIATVTVIAVDWGAIG